MDGVTESGPAPLRGFCLLKTLLMSLSRIETVVLERAVELCICQVSDVLEVMRPMGWS